MSDKVSDKTSQRLPVPGGPYMRRPGRVIGGSNISVGRSATGPTPGLLHVGPGFVGRGRILGNTIISVEIEHLTITN